MDRKVFMAFLLSIVVVGLIALALSMFRPFLLAFLWAGVLATTSFGLYEKVSRWLGGRKNLAALAMTLLVTVLIVAPFIGVGIVLVGEVSSLTDPDSWNHWLDTIDKDPSARLILEKLRWVPGLEEVEPSGVIKIAKESLTNLLVDKRGEIAGTVTITAGYVFGFAANLFFILLLLFYLYRDGPAFMSAFRELLPLRPDDTAEILGDIRAAIIASVHGGLVTAVAQGFLGFIIVFILGVDKPVLWAALIAIASLIPVVGTALVWVPLAAWFALHNEMMKALILVAYGVLVIGMADNFLRPLLVGRHMEAHPMLLFFGILGGIAMFGFAGIILGPVVIAFLTVTTRLFRREFRSIEEDLAGEAAPPS